MNYEKLVGNEPIKEMLRKTVQMGNILHSYLLVGIEGIGKQLFAKEFAKSILCLEEKNSEKKPCLTCKSCLEFIGDNHPDFIQIEPEGNVIKIEQIRQMQTKVLEKPILSNRKIYLIHDSHSMTKEAQNCLLKTLEEPPEYVTILLISSQESSLLPTIRSRCTKITFQPIEELELKKYLEQQEILKQCKQIVLKSFGGSIGRAIQRKDKIDIYGQVEEVVESIDTLDKIDFLKKADVIYKNKEDIYDILDYITLLFYQKVRWQRQNDYLNFILFIDRKSVV